MLACHLLQEKLIFPHCESVSVSHYTTKSAKLYICFYRENKIFWLQQMVRTWRASTRRSTWTCSATLTTSSLLVVGHGCLQAPGSSSGAPTIRLDVVPSCTASCSCVYWNSMQAWSWLFSFTFNSTMVGKQRRLANMTMITLQNSWLSLYVWATIYHAAFILIRDNVILLLAIGTHCCYIIISYCHTRLFLKFSKSILFWSLSCVLQFLNCILIINL